MAVENIGDSLFFTFENFVQLILEFVLVLIDFISVIIITVAIILALIYFVKNFKKILDPSDYETQNIRIRLGKMLLIGLDVMIAADILRTIIKQTPTDLLVLAVIVGIRIVITWILSKETGSKF